MHIITTVVFFSLYFIGFNCQYQACFKINLTIRECNSSLVLDGMDNTVVGNDLKQGNKNQKWNLVPADGRHVIRNAATGNCIVIEGDSCQKDTKIITIECGKSESQFWNVNADRTITPHCNWQIGLSILSSDDNRLTLDSLETATRFDISSAS